MGKIKRILTVFLLSLVCLGLFTLPVQASGENWTLSYSMGWDGSNFVIQGLALNMTGETAETLTIDWPSSVTYNEPSVPTTWARSTSGNSVNYQLAGQNTQADIETFLNAVSFSGTYGLSTGYVTVNVTDRVLSSRVDDQGVTHYYEQVQTTGGASIDWVAAYNAAKGRTYRGLTGYLATITSAAEHTFIGTTISGGSSLVMGWVGGTRTLYNGNRINDEGSLAYNPSTHYPEFDPEFTVAGSTCTGACEWYWADGPEAGEVFYEQPTYALGGTGAAVGYDGWDNPSHPGSYGNQPDAAGSGWSREAYMQLFWHSYLWNDFPVNNTLVTAYYVEYSAYGSQVETPEGAYYSALLPLPPEPTVVPTPAGRTCQDDGYPDGYYWNGTACVPSTTAAPSPSVTPSPAIHTTSPLVSSSPKVSPSASPSVSPSISPSASPSTSPSASASTSPSPTDSGLYIETVEVNNEQYGIIEKTDTIFGEEWYMEHFVSKDQYYAYPNLGVFVKANPCILHFLIALVALALQLGYNHKAKKDLKDWYEKRGEPHA